MALVTSRDALSDLVTHDRALRLTLAVLTGDEARALLIRVLGGDRVAAEPAAADELARLCVYLPLALRIAAANLDDGESIADYNARLAAGDRLGSLQVVGDEQNAVRAAFGLSYAGLAEPVRRMFRLLGLVSGPDFSTEAAASLAAVDRAEAARLLGRLRAAHLVDEPEPGRFAFHDLLRDYATELTGTLDPAPDRTAAVHRLLDHHLHSADSVAMVLNPQRHPITLATAIPGVIPETVADTTAAAAWFAAERPALLAAIDQAAAAGFDTHAWQLARSCTTYLNRQGHWRDWAISQGTALAAARRAGDRLGQAHVHRDLGLAHLRLGRVDDAHAHYRDALELYTELGERTSQASTHLDLTELFGSQQRYAELIDHGLQALTLSRAADRPSQEASALSAVGWAYAELGNVAAAVAYCEQAVALSRRHAGRWTEAAAWHSMGKAHQHGGDHRQAVVSYRRSLALIRDVGDRFHEAETLDHIGDAHAANDDAGEAVGAWRAALEIYTELGHAQAEAVRAKITR